MCIRDRLKSHTSSLWTLTPVARTLDTCVFSLSVSQYLFFFFLHSFAANGSLLYSFTLSVMLSAQTKLLVVQIPAGSPLRGGAVGVYVFDINQPSLPTPFIMFLCLISVFMPLSTVFHSINSPDNSPLSHSVLPVLFLLYWSFVLYISS